LDQRNTSEQERLQKFKKFVKNLNKFTINFLRGNNDKNESVKDFKTLENEWEETIKLLNPDEILQIANAFSGAQPTHAANDTASCNTECTYTGRNWKITFSISIKFIRFKEP
jgi:hypothetical protein